MFINRYAAPCGRLYTGCGSWRTQREAEEAGRQAERYALQGTRYLGTRLDRGMGQQP